MKISHCSLQCIQMWTRKWLPLLVSSERFCRQGSMSVLSTPCAWTTELLWSSGILPRKKVIIYLIVKFFGEILLNRWYLVQYLTRCTCPERCMIINSFHMYCDHMENVFGIVITIIHDRKDVRTNIQSLRKHYMATIYSFGSLTCLLKTQVT